MERPHVGVPGQQAAIGPPNNHRPGQHLPATKQELLSCAFPKFLPHNSKGENSCVEPLNAEVIWIRAAAQVTEQSCQFRRSFNSVWSPNALRFGFSVMKSLLYLSHLVVGDVKVQRGLVTCLCLLSGAVWLRAVSCP